MSELLKQATRNENIFVLSLMSGETTPIYFSTYIGQRFFNKVLKYCLAIEIHTNQKTIRSCIAHLSKSDMLN